MKGMELREFRKSLGLTQEALAKRLDSTGNTVARWERDEIGIPGYLRLAMERLEQIISEEKKEIIPSDM